MEYDFKILSKVFNDKYDLFFETEKNKNINSSFYALGVLLRSDHLKYKNIRPYNPKDEELSLEWDLNTWIKTTWGADDIKSHDEFEKEFDIALKNKPYYDFLMIQAITNHRPPWCIFGLVGMMQGTLNRNKYIHNDDNIFTKEDFIRNLLVLPHSFINQYKVDFEYLFNYFDEQDNRLKIIDKDIFIDKI